MAQVQTRKVQAIKIYNRVSARNTNPDLLRAKVLKELQAKIGMTAGAASTYYANMKNGNWKLDIAPVKAVKPVAVVKAVKPKLAVVKTPVAKAKPAKAVATVAK